MQMARVLSRITAHPNISMWGTLYANQVAGDLVGWIVDTWSERGIMPPLRPKMHWVPKEDGKFYDVQMNIDLALRRSFEVFNEDTEIESQRAAFITATLGIWEQEYLEERARRSD